MKSHKRIHIGTSGWNYKHWRGTFYPEDLSSGEWLSYYIKKFQTVEINNSFYQLPSEDTFGNWRKTAPPNFRFAVKASRYITHMKKLKDPEEPVQNFLERVDVLEMKLGPILFQLPGQWKFNKERLITFLDQLPEKYKYTIEFRNREWWNDETYELLNRHHVAFCMFQLGGVLSPKAVTTDFVYVRLHGPGDKYQGLYDKQTLSGWAGSFSAWAGKNKDIYCYFDNDEKGFAAQNALQLNEMIQI